MKILMVASESNPLAKTGGLADVVYALSRELALLGETVAIAMPYYADMKKKSDLQPTFVGTVDVWMSWRKQRADFYLTVIDGIRYYLVANDFYFGRPGLYGYYDDGERFAFFTQAVRNMLKVVNLCPDVIHLHDWQPGMLPVLIKEQNADDPFYQHIHFVTTIHNPAFQGLFDPRLLGDFYNLPESLYHEGQVRFKGTCSSLKAALVYSDKVTTVSPTHAAELLTPEGGQGLNDVIVWRRRDFEGILNGIDYVEWDPSKDAKIDTLFNAKTVKQGKAKNRHALYEKMNLVDEGQPLFGIVSRLTWQKGVDLMIASARVLLSRGASLVVLGSGEYTYEQDMEQLRSQYPGKMAVYIGYNDALAHQIYAASDALLMPSLFEPCGISQMIALRYGTLPLVRLTGGLRDTVIPYDGHNLTEANGFGFDAYETGEAERTTAWALDTIADEGRLATLRQTAMASDHAWVHSAQAYLALYQSLGA